MISKIRTLLDHPNLQAEWDRDGQVYISVKQEGTACTIAISTFHATEFVNLINSCIGFANEAKEAMELALTDKEKQSIFIT